jgi:hypothetical protein
MNTQNIRVSDAERTEVADRLAKHFADGRLDQAEFDDRVSRAMSAKTRADFEGLFDDLPDRGLPGTGAPAGGKERFAQPSQPRATQPGYGRRHRGPVRPILLVLLILLAVSVTVHVPGPFFIWAFTPWWLVALAVIIIVSRTRRRSRPR